jgi:hypothetical protein
MIVPRRAPAANSRAIRSRAVANRGQAGPTHDPVIKALRKETIRHGRNETIPPHRSGDTKARELISRLCKAIILDNG